MGIKISRNDFDAMFAYAKAELPKEACGLVAGTEIDCGKIVKRIYFLTNLDKSSEHFSLSPREQLDTVKDVRQNGWQLIGNWHSHPTTPARPSQEDIRLARDPKAIYFILSLAEDTPVLKAFRIEKGAAAEESVEFFSDGNNT